MHANIWDVFLGHPVVIVCVYANNESKCVIYGTFMHVCKRSSLYNSFVQKIFVHISGRPMPIYDFFPSVGLV